MARGGIGAMAVIGVALVGSVSFAALPDRPQFATGASEVLPGQEIDVSGIGCSPDGFFDVDGPEVGVLFSRVDPPGNSLGIALLGDNQISGSVTAVGVPGESADFFSVDEHGRWSGTLTIATDAPVGEEFVLRGVCLTRVEPFDVDGDLDEVDFDSAYFEVGPFTIRDAVAAPPDADDDTALPDAPAAPPATPAPTAPTFTG
jgi:hypothetical protein